MRRFASAMLVVVLGLAACGDGGGTTETQETLQDLSGQSLEVAAVFSGSEQENFEKVLDRFEQQTKATTSFTSTGDDIATVLGTRIEGGKAPDVAILPQPGLLRDLVGRKALQPIEDAAGKVVDQHYARHWRELGTVDGQLYGVWFKAANKSTVWYNIGAFKDAGVQPPGTWDELKTAAQTILDSGVKPFSIGGADGWTLTDWFENVYIRTAGPENYDKLGRHEMSWTDESVKTALRRLAEIFGKPVWINGGTAGALQTNFDNSVPPVYTDPPKAAMVYEGAFVADVITANTKAKLGTDADFFDFPSIDGSPAAVVGGGDVAVLLKDSPAGRELIKFLATPEAAEVWAAAGGFTSPNKNVDLAVYPDDITRKAAEALAKAQTFRFDMSDLQPAAFGATKGQGMWGILQDFLRTPSDVDGIAQKLEAAAEKAFK